MNKLKEAFKEGFQKEAQKTPGFWSAWAKGPINNFIERRIAGGIDNAEQVDKLVSQVGRGAQLGGGGIGLGATLYGSGNLLSAMKE
jgi:hypothetical protein